LEAPHPHVPGQDGKNDIAVTMDGVTYCLDTDSAPPFGNGRLGDMLETDPTGSLSRAPGST